MAQKLRQPPRDTKSEVNLLASIISEPDRYDEVMQKYPLTADDFFDERNRIVFNFIQTMLAEGVTLISAERLRAMARVAGVEQKINDHDFFISLFANNSFPADAVFYASVIKRYSQIRSGIATAEKFSEELYNHPDDQAFNQALAQLENDTHSLIDNVTDIAHKGPQLAWNVFADWYKEAEESRKRGEDAGGVKTGFTGLDNVITGLKPGTMNIFAAQPGVGKTALGLNILANIAKTPNLRKPVVVFSLEMTAWQVIWRVVSFFTAIPIKRFQNNKLTEGDKGRIDAMTRRPSEVEALVKNMFIDDDGYMTPGIIRQRCRRLFERYGGLSAIMVDHVQIMNGDRKSYNNDVTKFAEISRQLKIISKEFKCPVIVLSQLSRKIDDRKDHEPKNSDLKETSGLEQDADLICFIQRDPKNETGEAKLKITKNRHGSLGEVNLAFNGELTMFSNLE